MPAARPTYTVILEDVNHVVLKQLNNVQESQLAAWSDKTLWTSTAGLFWISIFQN